MGEILVATAAQPRSIYLDRTLGACQQERNINGRAGGSWFNLSNELKRVSSSTAFSRRGTPVHKTGYPRIADARICFWRQADFLVSFVMVSIGSNFSFVQRCLQN